MLTRQIAFPSLETIGKILDLLVQAFGTSGTIILFAMFILGSFGWRYYNDRRKDREIRQLVEEKERTIQRLAKQECELRIYWLKNMAGWTDEQVERFIMLADFPDGPSARRALEEGEHRS